MGGGNGGGGNGGGGSGTVPDGRMGSVPSPTINVWVRWGEAVGDDEHKISFISIFVCRRGDGGVGSAALVVLPGR